MRQAWPTKKLGEICEVVGGGTPSTSNSSYWNGEYSWATPRDLGQLLVADINSTARTISALGLEHSPARLLPVGSVILSSRAPIGYVAINEVEMATNQGCRSFICSSKIYNRYLYYFLRNSTELLKSIGSGATFLEVSGSSLKELEIPLPPLTEQKRIVEILDDADRLRQLRKKANDRMAAFLPALFLDMFGDPQTNPKEWPVVTLAEIGDAGQYGLNAAATKENDGVRFIRITDIDDAGYLGRAEPAYVPHAIVDGEKYELQPGDILIARSGATAGKSYMHRPLKERAVFAGYLIRFCLNRTRALPIFVASFLQTAEYWRQLRSHKRAVAQPNVNAKQLGALRFPLPPLDLQKKFAALAADAEVEMQKQSRATVRLEDLFQSLLAQAFSNHV